ISRLHPDMGVAWLKNDEWLSLQIKDGPCSAACAYCYGIPELKEEAVKFGLRNQETSVAELLKIVPENKLEMSLDVVKKLLGYIKELGVKHVNLIGSEPTEHTQFGDILNTFVSFGISAAVYTNGRHLDKLLHPAIGRIILHITQMPDDSYMEIVKRLIKQGTQIDIRVNFSEKSLPEKRIIEVFLSKLSAAELSNILIKYSITSSVPKQGIKGFDLNSFKEGIKTALLNWLKDTHKKYPQTMFFSERVLFRCCFTDKELEDYSFANIVFKCSMEFTIYRDRRMKLCSPGISAISGYPISSPEDILSSVEKVRLESEKYFLKPSFEECKPCPHRISLECYGGCIGYKLS
ncbi:MAG: radical SAM protein, partial [Elusimicrobia bacterium]|nr:radical SAM protein [Elusimicrobiota bacterium]